ncbi:E3 ubiquitin-protein ligase CIP8-like [Amaranthus tricolor]|uniref:E3 ubiquitin-protein ligase CIP8-like n=1 Tax=Amaranthus tricolor TaxID=29722 RepID=UPI00258C6E3B|nr:E3 ubiquitin-protein ligase CIP8-like [Amaranthus tricolor]
MEEVDPPQQQLLKPHHTCQAHFFTAPQSPTHPSVFSISDSEPDSCDLDPSPIFHPDEDQVSFVNDMFQHSSSQFGLISGSSIGVGLGLGLGFGSGDQSYRLSSDAERSDEIDLELGLGHRNCNDNSVRMNEETRRFEGLRVVNIDDSDSDSDYEDGINFTNHDNRQGLGAVSDFDRPPYCWDYLGFNNGNRTENIEFDRRETDVGSVVNDNFDEFFIDEDYNDEDEDVGTPIQLDTDVSNVFDTYRMRSEQQEISIDSDTDVMGEFGSETYHDFEWELLFAVNNFNRQVNDLDFNVDMYEAILGEMEDHMNEWRGSPPAAESVIENLSSIQVAVESLEEDEVVCAICRDEVLGKEVMKQLPCLHYYHGDCIVPWLKIRNTCPVCRHELPTDDAEYENQKRAREQDEWLNLVSNEDLTQDSQLRYDFHVFL